MNRTLKFKTIFLTTIILASIFCSCKKNRPNSCNGKNTRREIKLATDAAANQIDLTPIPISVASFGELSVTTVKSDSPRQAAEKKVYTITAKVHKLGHHRDGDWKVKLTDGNDNFVNCEAPNTGCEFIVNSKFLTEYEDARSWIIRNKKTLEGKTVTITGIGFIDIDHRYPRNAAPNEMEIHPILDIHF